jgi:hypothetical protein
LGKGSGATPFQTQDLFFRDAISIPTAPTNISCSNNQLQICEGA